MAYYLTSSNTNQDRSPVKFGQIYKRDNGEHLLGNQVKRDGPTSGVGNNLSTDGPDANRTGNNLSTDGPDANRTGNNLLTDGPEASRVGNNLSTDGPKQKSEFKEKAEAWKKYSEKNILPVTTFISVGFNLISAFFRLFGKNNPIVKLLNKLSLNVTRIHQIGYGLSGIGTALAKKNLFYLFSFGSEIAVAFAKLRNMYLWKGLPSSLDIVPSCIKKYTKDEFESFSESIPKTLDGIWKTMKEALMNWRIMLKPESLVKQWPIIGAALSILGIAIGVTVHEKIGSGIRDIGAVLNDCGLLFNESATAKKSGRYYIGGSSIDFAANLVGKKDDTGVLGNIKDSLHELSLASDRLGQKNFLHFVNEEESEAEKKSLHKKEENEIITVTE